MTPSSSIQCNFFFTLLASIEDFGYNPIFPYGESRNSWILCYTSLLCGNPLWSRNTSLFSYKKSSKFCFYLLLNPSNDALPLIHSYAYEISLKNILMVLESLTFMGCQRCKFPIIPHIFLCSNHVHNNGLVFEFLKIFPVSSCEQERGVKMYFHKPRGVWIVSAEL